MRHQAVLFAVLSIIVTSDAWLSNHMKRVSVKVMGSRAADKRERKKQWLDKRGGDASAGDDASSGGQVPFSEIIGSGRIGALLAEAGKCKVLGREDSIDSEGKGSILIATRNDSLESIVEKCPENRRKDLVFMQNGYLDKFLDSKGLLGNTQVLLYLSKASMEAKAVDGVTSVNPEGLTAATGIHAQAFADRLASLDLKCNVVSPKSYRPAMFEKLIWISTYMLVGTAKECKSVGQASEEYRDIVEAVVNELTAAVCAKEGIEFPDGTMARLAAYTDVVADFPCAVKEFQWRNQYFFDLGDDACPTHNGLLRDCAEKGFLGFELP
jgi:hypothetical protein